MIELTPHLESNGVILPDFGQDECLKNEYLHDLLHLNEQEREVFTALIVDALRALSVFNLK